MHQGPIMSLAGTTYETLFECQQYSNQQPSYRSAFLSPNSGIFVTQPDYKSHLAVRLRHTQLSVFCEAHDAIARTNGMATRG